MPGFISNLILPHLARNGQFCIVDGGAQAGTEASKWGFLGPWLRLDGFEPDAAECQRLNAQAKAAGASHFYHAACLGREEGQSTLYITKKPDSSSMYPPAEKRLRRWKQCTDGRNPFCTIDYLALDRKAEVPTTTIDRWAKSNGIGCIDFVKVDVQGAELDVLQGAVESLEQVLAVEAEVEFVPLYENQPLFADVDAFLRGRGFTFFNLHFTHGGHYAGRIASPLNVAFGPNALLRPQQAGQLVTADAFYLVDPLDHLWPAGRTMSPSKYLKLILIAESCNQLEFAFELLAAARDRSAPLGEYPADIDFGGIFQQAVAQYVNASKR